MLLGDTSTEREEKREQTPLLFLLLLSSPLSNCVCTLQLSLLHLLRLLLLLPSCSASSLQCVSVSLHFFSLSFAVLSYAALPPLYLSTVAAPRFSLLSPSVSALKRGVAGTGGWQTALCEVQGSFEISAGSRRFIKKAFSMKRAVHF